MHDHFNNRREPSRYFIDKGFQLSIGILFLLVLTFGTFQSAKGAGSDLYVDPAGVDGTNDCLTASSPCKTIGYAVNKVIGGETIHIAAGTYVENISLHHSMTLQGAGMYSTIIDGNAAGRVIDCSGVSTALNLADLTIQNGLVSAVGNIEGAGIRGYCGQIEGNRIRITGNHAGSGGAYFGWSYLYLTDTIITGNYADQDGSASYGGGLFLSGNPETILTRVTISGNTALGVSGGIHSQAGTGAMVSIINTTITENTGNMSGALDNTASTQMTITNSTIASNHTTGGGTGGITNYAIMNLQNTIVADNDGANCYKSGGTWTSLGNNIDSGSTCSFTSAGDLQNTDPLLSGLEDNGGYTLTMALEDGSPAIDAANGSACPSIDQRGVSRPQGIACDIGAFEKEAAPGDFTLKAPANNAIKRPANLTLKWNPSINATEYFYCLKKQGGSCSWMSVGNLTSVPVTGLSPATTYVWEIFAQNPAGLTYANGGAWWTFTTLPKPGAFNKTSPASGTVNKPTTLTLYWGSSTNAAKYEYCLKTSMSAACTWKSTGLIKKVTLTGLAKNTKYYWQVRAKNPMGTTLANGGTFWNFKTKP